MGGAGAGWRGRAGWAAALRVAAARGPAPLHGRPRPTRRALAAPPLTYPPLEPQAKDALSHPYFDDLDKAAVDALENPDLEDAGEPDF